MTISSSEERRLFRERLANALRTHLYPNTPLRACDLATAVGVTKKTIEQYRDGTSHPCALKVGNLMRFLPPSFAFAVYGEMGFVYLKIDDMVKAKQVIQAAMAGRKYGDAEEILDAFLNDNQTVFEEKVAL